MDIHTAYKEDHTMHNISHNISVSMANETTLSINIDIGLIDAILSEVEEDIELTDQDKTEVIGRLIKAMKVHAARELRKLVMNKVAVRIGDKYGQRAGWEAVGKYWTRW